MTEVDEGMFFLGLQAAAWRVPFLPTRAGLGSDVLRVNPDLRLVRSPYGAGSTFLTDPADADVELVAMPALRLDAAIVHTNRADTAGNGQVLAPDPFFDALFLGAAERRFLTTERIVAEGALADEGHPLSTVPIHRMLTDAVAARSQRRPLHRQPARLRARRGVPEGVRGRRGRPGRVGRLRRPLRAGRGGRVPGPGEGTRAVVSDVGVTRAETCAVACAEVWRDAGEVMASPFGVIPSLGARLAKLTFAPDLVLTDGEAALMVGAPPISTPPAELVREAAMPYRSVFDVVWSGRRHIMMMASQIDRTGNQNISAIGDHAHPKVQLVGVRGAPGNSVNHPTSYWVPKKGFCG